MHKGRILALGIVAAAYACSGAAPLPAKSDWHVAQPPNKQKKQDRQTRLAAHFPNEFKDAKGSHGQDSRVDYHDLNAKQRGLADATCLITDASRISPKSRKSVALVTTPYRVRGLSACPNEAFRTQPTLGWCSGFLAAPDLVVTAGHCVNGEDVTDLAFVFGFKMTSRTTRPKRLPRNRVYRGASIVSLNSKKTFDYAVIRLDRPVSPNVAVPLKLRVGKRVNLGERIGLIGYPRGLPVKAAFGRRTTIKHPLNPRQLLANLDAYRGNSGSPVFDTRGHVIGIVVRGSRDFSRDGPKNCFKSIRHPDQEGAEVIVKSSIFARALRR